MLTSRAWGRSVAALAAAGLLAGGARPASGQSDDAGRLEVSVEVELTCPSCAQRLERRLGRLEHVAGVVVQGDAGRLVVTAEPGRSLDFGELRDVIRNAGFVPTAIVVTAVGRVAAGDDRAFLVLSDDARLWLAPGGRTDALVAEAAGAVVALTGHAVLEPGAAGHVQVETYDAR